MSMKPALRAATVVAALGITGLFGAGVASAHVTANVYGAEPQKGGYGTIALRVPNEEENAGTVKVEVDFKPEYAISSVRYKPIPGWTAEVTKTPQAAPIKNGKNLDVSTPVTKIVFTAQPGTKIAAGDTEFQEFELSLGSLPSNVDELVLPAIQTYEDGTVVDWSQEAVAGGAEPDHPAPTVALAAASSTDDHGMAMGSSDASDSGSADATDDTARWLGGAGLIVGALGLGFGAGATLRARKAK